MTALAISSTLIFHPESIDLGYAASDDHDVWKIRSECCFCNYDSRYNRVEYSHFTDVGSPGICSAHLAGT